MTNTTSPAILPQQAITVLTSLSVSNVVRADAISPLWVSLIDQLIALGLADEFDNGPDAVRVFRATDSGRLALARANQAARDAMGAFLFDVTAAL